MFCLGYMHTKMVQNSTIGLGFFSWNYTVFVILYITSIREKKKLPKLFTADKHCSCAASLQMALQFILSNFFLSKNKNSNVTNKWKSCLDCICKLWGKDPDVNDVVKHNVMGNDWLHLTKWGFRLIHAGFATDCGLWRGGNVCSLWTDSNPKILTPQIKQSNPPSFPCSIHQRFCVHKHNLHIFSETNGFW